MYFDTHTHLDDEKFDPDRELVIENLKKEGVSLAVNVGADLTSSKNSIALAEQYDFIYAAVGVHPNEVGEMQDEDLETLADMAKHEKVVAIGEIGLDYHYDEPGRDVQKLWFEKQLRLAQALNMPFIVHDRDAHQDTLELLKKVIARILNSYYENRRTVKLFFYYPSDEYIAYLMTVEELLFSDEIDCRDLFDGNNVREKIVIFEIAV